MYIEICLLKLRLTFAKSRDVLDVYWRTDLRQIDHRATVCKVGGSGGFPPNLSGVHLKGVHLIGVCLMGVYLTGVHLTGVHLIGMCLMGVHLMGLCLMDVYVTGVCLMGIHFMVCIS